MQERARGFATIFMVAIQNRVLPHFSSLPTPSLFCATDFHNANLLHFASIYPEGPLEYLWKLYWNIETQVFLQKNFFVTVKQQTVITVQYVVLLKEITYKIVPTGYKLLFKPKKILKYHQVTGSFWIMNTIIGLIRIIALLYLIHISTKFWARQSHQSSCYPTWATYFLAIKTIR